MLSLFSGVNLHIPLFAMTHIKIHYHATYKGLPAISHQESAARLQYSVYYLISRPLLMIKILRASTPALFIPSFWKSCRTFRFNLPSIWDMTQEQLAYIVDRAPRTIMYNENDGQHPSLNTFYQMVTMFDISVNQYFYPSKNKGSECRKRID